MRYLKAAVFAVFVSTWAPSTMGDDVTEPAVRIGFANPVLIVKNLEESTTFYTEIMGYEVVGGDSITAEVSKRTVGANRDQNTRSVYLRSAKLKNHDLQASGIALIHIEDSTLQQIERGEDPDDAVQGEIMLSLVVEGLEELLRRLDKGGYTILNRLQPSASGRSNIASAVDPNGIRLEMYEYVD